MAKAATDDATADDTKDLKDSPAKDKAPAAETGNPQSNLLDMNNIDVKRMLAVAKKSGLVPTSKLNEHIDMEKATPDAIEVMLAQLSDLGISVIDDKDQGDPSANTLARTRTTAVKRRNCHC